MALRSGAQYLERVARRKPLVFLGGKRIEDLQQNPVTKTVVDAMAKVFDIGLEPGYQEVMTAVSPLIGDRVSRNLHFNASAHDLEMRADMALLTSQKLGTCNYRCPGCDMLNGLASTVWEVDRERGTEYFQRLMAYTRFLQEDDLALSGGVTDAKGDRSKRPSEQDPDMYVHVVEKRSDGIVVRGAKQHQSGAYAADETLVLPGLACRPGEEDYALAFGVTNGTRGITYIAQYTSFTAEREGADSIWHLGNPLYGQRETCLMIFDDVFIPWEKVFLCGEVEYTQRMIARFAKMHRMNCGGACKVGFADLIIGASQLLAEYIGLGRTAHIVDKITQMVKIRETSYACAIAAAFRGLEEPPGSGIWLPDDAFSNVAKLNTCYGFWELMALAGDIAGGVVATMPHEKDLENPETRAYIEKYCKASVPASKRLRMVRFLQNWVAGTHGVATWHGAGSSQAQMLTLYRVTDFQEKQRLARELAGIED